MGSGKYREILNKVLIFLVAVLIIIILSSLINSYTVVHPPRRSITLTPSEYGMGYETVSFESLDGLRLKGWFIPNILKNESHPLIIVCHGHGANKGNVLFAAKLLHNNGYNVLLFDFRAHGESEGSFASLGWLEPNDLKGAIEYAKNRFNPKNIGVMGFSMGGTTAITTAGQTPEIRAVVADSAFADRFKLISKASRFPPPFAYLTPMFAQIQGMNMDENLPVNYAENITPNALLIIQGDQDNLVETEDAISLYNKAKDPKEIWLVQDTPHVGAYQTQRQDYEKRVLLFFNEYL